MKAIALDCHLKFKQTIFDILEAAECDDEIIANYFAIREDSLGVSFLHRLHLAACRGANVKLILDSYGSFHKSSDGTEYSGGSLSQEILSLLSDAGVEIFVFNPINSSNKFAISNLLNWDNFTRRNHNKYLLFDLKKMEKKGIVLGDSQWALEHFNNEMRGHNLAFFGEKPHCQASSYTNKLLGTDFIKSFIPDKNLCPNKLEVFEEIFEQEFDFNHQSWSWYKNDNIHICESADFVFSDIEIVCPTMRKTIQSYEMELIEACEQEFWYCTPYFAPDKEFKRLFREVCSLKKHNILIGKFRNDPFLPYGVKSAAKELYGSGVNLHEYVGDGNIHYKDMVCDDKVFVKSANGEGRSRYFNLDAGLIMKSKSLAAYMRQRLEKEMSFYKKMNLKTRYLCNHPIPDRFIKTALRPLYYHHL